MVNKNFAFQTSNILIKLASEKEEYDLLCKAVETNEEIVIEEEPVVEIEPYTEEKVDFVLNRPFLFVINGQDGQPLFIGIVNQPK